MSPEKEDHLSGEVSLSAEITPTGVKAAAKGRLISALDRLGGNLVERLNVRLESKTEVQRAKADGQVAIIKAAAAVAAARVSVDTATADRVLEQHFEEVFKAGANKAAVAHAAIEDLRRSPPNEAESSAGGETLSEEFLSKFQRYAGEAETEGLREKWGRVLAAEVRVPGTVTGKVMRIVDELDGETARRFEELCESRLGDALPLTLIGPLSYDDQARMVGAGLVDDPGLGVSRPFVAGRLGNGEEVWICSLQQYGLVMPTSSWEASRWKNSLAAKEEPLIRHADNQPAMPCIILTPAGIAVARILPDLQETALKKFIERLETRIIGIKAYRKSGPDTMSEFVPK